MGENNVSKTGEVIAVMVGDEHRSEIGYPDISSGESLNRRSASIELKDDVVVANQDTGSSPIRIRDRATRARDGDGCAHERSPITSGR